MCATNLFAITFSISFDKNVKFETGRKFFKISLSVAYVTGRNNTEVHRSYFIHSVNQVKLQYINKQSSMSDIIMNNTGIGIIKIRMIIFNLFYATIMQLTSIPAL